MLVDISFLLNLRRCEYGATNLVRAAPPVTRIAGPWFDRYDGVYSSRDEPIIASAARNLQPDVPLPWFEIDFSRNTA